MSGDEGLFDKVHRARFESLRLGALVIVRGEEYHGDIPELVVGLQLLDHGKPVLLRHVDIKEDQVGVAAVRGEEVHGVFSRGRRMDGVFFPQQTLGHPEVHGVVVHHEDVGVPVLVLLVVRALLPAAQAEGRADLIRHLLIASRESAVICLDIGFIVRFRRRSSSGPGRCPEKRS